MKKIRLLFMIPTLGQGGAEKVLINLVNNLDKTRFDVTVLTLFDTGVNKQFLHSDVHYCFCMKRSFRGNVHFLKFFSPRTLYKHFVASKGEFDVLVSYLEGPTARIVSGCNNASSKLVSWIHGEQHTQKKASNSFRSINEASSCYRKFDNTVCVAKTVKDDFLELFPNLPSCEVLYNTVESERIIRLSKEKITETYHNNVFNLIAVGTLKEVKGFDRLLRIIRRLVMENYLVHLYILGRGPLQKQFKNYIINNHIETYITLLGYQTNPYKFVAKADLFVCSSYREGFSTAATEALILGTPVCTVEVSGMKEMLGSNNEYGIITENNENALYIGIKKMLDNPDLLIHYRKMAAERGTAFRTDATVNAVEKMFERIVSR